MKSTLKPIPNASRRQITYRENILLAAIEEYNTHNVKKYSSWQDAISEITNSIETPSEGLVDTLFDYNHNKEQPRLFSQIVYDITKRRLGK